MLTLSKKNQSRSLIALVAACLASGTLAGCSNNPYPAGEAEQPILNLAIADDPKTFDPQIAYDIAAGTVIDPIYPSYLSYQYLDRNPFVLQLNLGAAEPEATPLKVMVTEKDKDGKETKVTKDGQMWTFRIKKGLHFQDDPCFPGGKGREITAADFLYSFRRMADPTVPCPVISFFDDKILGIQEYEKHQSDLIKAKQPVDYSFPMEGLELDPNDPYTFRIKLSQPYPQLRFLMAMHFTTPMAHEAVERYGKKLAAHPVGCGPYQMQLPFVPKAGIVLKANPNYRKDDFYPSQGAPGDAEAGLLADAGKAMPFVQEVHFQIFREGTTAWNSFLQGYLDFSGVNQNNFQQVMSTSAQANQLSPEMKQRNIGLHKDVAVDVSYFGFNMNDPVVGNVDANLKPLPPAEALKHRKLRQAISCSIDAQKYIDIIYLGLGKSAQSIIAPGLFGYDPNYKNPYREYPPNLDKAKKLLAEAGYPDGIDPKTGDKLTIYWENSLITALGRQEIQLFKEMIEKIGIRVEPRAWRGPVFQAKVDAAAQRDARLAAGEVRRQRHAHADPLHEVQRPFRDPSARNRQAFHLRHVQSPGPRGQGQGRRFAVAGELSPGRPASRAGHLKPNFCLIFHIWCSPGAQLGNLAAGKIREAVVGFAGRVRRTCAERLEIWRRFLWRRGQVDQG